MENEKKACFFIAPIGEEDSPERKRSNQVLTHIIQPVLARFHYKVTRADQITKPGLITSQIIQDVLKSDIVIADLTGRNPNVFYELALRHAVRKPFIQMIEEGAKIPFDVSGLRTIHLNHQDLDSVERCKKQLEDHVLAIEQNPSEVESPVAVAIDMERLRSSSLPADQYILEVREFQSEIAQRMYLLELALGQLISAQPPRLEYKQLPDGKWANVFTMPPAYVPSLPAVSLIEKNTPPSSTADPEPSPEFARRAMKLLRKAAATENQPSTQGKDSKK